MIWICDLEIYLPIFSCRTVETWRMDNNILLVAPKIEVLSGDVMGYQCPKPCPNDPCLYDLAVPVDGGVRTTYFLEDSGILVVRSLQIFTQFDVFF